MRYQSNIPSLERRIASILPARSVLSPVTRLTGRQLADRIRPRILDRDGYRCQVCGLEPADLSELDVEHRIPLWAGGKENDANRWTLCKRCHKIKTMLESRIQGTGLAPMVNKEDILTEIKRK